MPYNFEATFVQPLLTQLDNGLIKGSEDWANAITKAYITTIKTGLPQGLPLSLPAPGLNPTAPPPYPLGVSSFSTADTRSKQMYTIIHAYFYAKELKLDKGNIESLIQTIKQLVQKLKAKTQQVKSLIEQANNIRKELSQLPQTIKEILQDLKDEIKQRFNDLKSTIDTLMNLKVEMGEFDFNNIFAQELRIINTLKNFDLTNIQGINELVSFLSQYEKRANNFIKGDSNDKVAVFKNYLKDKLRVVVKEFVELSKGASDPTLLLSFMSQLASTRARLEKVLAKIKRLDVVVRFLNPKLIALNKRKDEKVKEIKDNIQTKIVELQKMLQERISEYNTKKKKGKADLIYKNANKTIKSYKKNYADKAKKIKDKIVLYKELTKDAIIIYNKSKEITEEVLLEFDNIKLEIEKIRKYPKVKITVVADKVEDKYKDIVKVKDLPKTYPNVIQNDALSPKQLQRELNKTRQYFNSLGLSQFSKYPEQVINQVKCDLKTFQQFFEKRLPEKYEQLTKKLTSLQHDVEKLINKIQSLRDNTKKAQKLGIQHKQLNINTSIKNIKQSGTGKYFALSIKSLKDLLSWIVTITQPTVRRIQSRIDTEIKNLTDFYKDDVKKGARDLRIYALNLVPLKSDVEDPKDKAAAAEAKLRAVKYKIKQVKVIIKKVNLINRAAVVGVKLVKNIMLGNYKFSENQQLIDQLLDAIYDYKLSDIESKVDEANTRKSVGVFSGKQSVNQLQYKKLQLEEEKLKIKSHFKSLVIVEILAYGLIETMKDLKETDFKKELQNILDNMANNIPGKLTLQKIKNLADNPPTDPKQLSEIAKDLGSGMLEDQSVITNLLNLERKYLNKSRQIVRTMCDIKELDNTKFRATLDDIKKTLDKDRSFIALGMKYLKTELKKFMIFIERQISGFLAPVKEKLKEKRKKIDEFAQLQLDKIKEKLVNVEAPIMSFTFGFAARSFWTGAQWTGPTGTNHVALNLGVFTPMKARSTDGASAMIREMARGFEAQLVALQGLVIPPANTGIVPVPFTGYK